MKKFIILLLSILNIFSIPNLRAAYANFQKDKEESEQFFHIIFKADNESQTKIFQNWFDIIIKKQSSFIGLIEKTQYYYRDASNSIINKSKIKVKYEDVLKVNNYIKIPINYGDDFQVQFVKILIPNLIPNDSCTFMVKSNHTYVIRLKPVSSKHDNADYDSVPEVFKAKSKQVAIEELENKII